MRAMTLWTFGWLLPGVLACVAVAADEILALHAAGLPMASALDAACWSAREWLGAEGLEEGARADVVLCREDPRKVPEAVRNLAHVVLGGRVVR